MTDTRPVDMPELRAELLEWTSMHGAHYFESCIREGAQRSFFYERDHKVEGKWFADTDADRLANAELYWVSREMTELCVSAARSMPEWQLAPEDVPAPHGFIYFEGLGPLRPDYPSTAFSWGPCPARAAGAGLKGGAGLWLSAYTDIATAYGVAGVTLGSMGVPLASFLYAGESVAAYGVREEGDVSIHSEDGVDVASDNDDALKAKVGSLALLKAAWLLMGQSLASATEATADRASLKRLKRMGREDLPARTRVISLRHRGNGDGTAADREFHHQWIVRGHWRQQWYPAREVHRPVWIAPHIKGPEGAPMLGGEKVYAWKR